jgi:sugar phosphate isomerase/epimerase
LDRLVEKLRTVSAACRAKGIKLGYHNHDFDVLPRIDGEPALFSLYSRMKSSELLAEPDVYWLRKGGVDEVETLRRYQGRILNAHLKDMTPDGRYAPVGGGILDMKEIIRTGIETGIEWFIVEQDQCYDRSPLECIEDSLGYIKRLELL